MNNSDTATSQVNTAPSFASFAVSGIVTTYVGDYSSYGSSVIVQVDGKILLGGSSNSGYSGYSASSDFALVRYNSDGSLDLSFDGDGIVTTALGDFHDYGNSVTLQADGKILLGGTSGHDFALVRYNADGSLDLSFDGDGKVTADLGSYNYGSSVTVQADGKILLGGYSIAFFLSKPNFVLVRYNANGSLDTSFDSDGIAVTAVNGWDYGSSVTVQNDGKILLGGYSYNNNDSDFALVRYNSDGSLDLSFDGDGKVTTAGGYAASVTVQTDGKILLGGVSNGDFALVRYNTDGSLDLGFGIDGKVITDLGGDDRGYSVTVQTDGKILLGGYSYNNNDSDNFALVRYNTDGSLDLSFDGDGKVTTAGGNGSSVTVQVDGKILLGGRGENGFALVRYNSDGSLDNSFNTSFNSNAFNILNGINYWGSGAVVLNDTVQIHDTELAVQDNYSGASITLARQGGANAEDVFSGSGLLSFNGGHAILSGITVGTVSNSNGTLSINFNNDATQARVNAVLSSIAYSNTSALADSSPVSIHIDWIFNDGNTGGQGTGGVLTTTGSSIIHASSDIHIYTTTVTTYGSTENDNLKGFSGNDTLDGGAGNDTLDGGQGADSLLGGLGNDLYIVNRGSDVVIENLNEGTDTIKSRSVYYHLPANVENLTLIGSHAINGKGNELANTLIGNNNDNHLFGGAGADRFIGGLGADTFKFNSKAETGITATTRDIIVDFSHSQGDKINLSAIDANTTFAGNNAFSAPTIGGTFSGVFANPGELYFDQTVHILYGNNDADSKADFSIKVTGVGSLAAVDFVL